MNVISLFCGCGGLDLGFERAGFNIPVANEFDPTIYETFKVNHPKTHLIEGDVRQITKDDIIPFIFMVKLTVLLADLLASLGQKQDL